MQFQVSIFLALICEKKYFLSKNKLPRKKREHHDLRRDGSQNWNVREIRTNLPAPRWIGRVPEHRPAGRWEARKTRPPT